MDTKTTGIYLTLITGLGFLTLLLMMFIYSIYRHSRQRLADFRMQVYKEIELIDGERDRIAADLHDELGAGIAAIGLLLQQVEGEDGAGKLEKAKKQLGQQQQKIREISHDLVPRILASHGLKVVLQDLFEDIRTAGSFQLDTNMTMEDGTFYPPKTIHVYRIVREIMTNTIKHAGATQIHCNCTQDDKRIYINIGDNGAGFDNRKAANNKGNGLRNIRTRCDLLGGTLTVNSTKATGTQYNIEIPLASMIA